MRAMVRIVRPKWTCGIVVGRTPHAKIGIGMIYAAVRAHGGASMCLCPMGRTIFRSAQGIGWWRAEGRVNKPFGLAPAKGSLGSSLTQMSLRDEECGRRA